jgi:O-antigen ligase
VLGGIVFYQYFNGVGRPSAQMNADVFGNLVVMMIFLSVIRIFEERSGQRWVTLFAVLMGLAAVVFSGTRGAWLSFLLLIPVYIWLMSSRYDSVHRKVFFIVIAVLLAIVVAAANMDVVKNRVLQAVQEVELWSGGDNKHTSVGLRLEMWSAAWQAAKESPWLGYGYRNTNPVVSQYASAEVRRKISGFNHLHNEYITSFLGRGIAGLLVLLCLLFLPLRVFIAGVKNDGRCPYAAMGVLLCVGYASFGMVNVAFGDAFMNAFYVIFLALLLPVVMRRTASDH